MTTASIRISVTDGRAKTANLRRDPRASLHVTRDDFYAYVVIEARAEVTPVAAAPDDATVDELVEYYRAVAGEHPDWDDYRRAMVADRRLVVRLRPERAYGMLPVTATDAARSEPDGQAATERPAPIRSTKLSW